jgi:hypothetical protein
VSALKIIPVTRVKKGGYRSERLLQIPVFFFTIVAKYSSYFFSPIVADSIGCIFVPAMVSNYSFS